MYFANIMIIFVCIKLIGFCLGTYYDFKKYSILLSCFSTTVLTFVLHNVSSIKQLRLSMRNFVLYF